jgi:hypothetical protein
MSFWRALGLSDQPDGEQIPPLLIKPHFGSDTYTIFLTDLSNIWSEELDVAGIVDRALQQKSPIEVSKQDTAQIAILLENVQHSLAVNDATSCSMTGAGGDGITLHTAISLPEPLGSLQWEFQLGKRTAVTLKDELILPLLVSSQIQHGRLHDLVSTITEKDRIITRLMDQYESSNLDLMAAFPSVGGLKSSRKVVKREQVAKHVPSFQVFDKDRWRRETTELHDTTVSTLDLFQEALSECTSKVPSRLLSDNGSHLWWNKIGTALKPLGSNSNRRGRANTTNLELASKSKPVEPECDADETEDEFEVHENFKASLSLLGPNVLLTPYSSQEILLSRL